MHSTHFCFYLQTYCVCVSEVYIHSGMYVFQINFLFCKGSVVLYLHVLCAGRILQFHMTNMLSLCTHLNEFPDFLGPTYIPELIFKTCCMRVHAIWPEGFANFGCELNGACTFIQNLNKLQAALFYFRSTIGNHNVLNLFCRCVMACRM